MEKAISQWEYYQITGHRNTASYGIQKLMWVKKHEPEVYRSNPDMFDAKDFMEKLTGVFCTDYSDANGCGFFDLKRLDWSEELLKLSGIDRSKLPDA
ncbi:MAG: FGGY family carbohydrate kinase [Eubacteriales bacterium]